MWGVKYPETVATWERAWERFTPFLDFPPMLRRVIYTTNSIESLNYQLRKVSENRGHSPSDEAVARAAVAVDLRHRMGHSHSPRQLHHRQQEPNRNPRRPRRSDPCRRRSRLAQLAHQLRSIAIASRHLKA